MKISAAQSLTCSVYASDATLALLSLPVAHATGTTLRVPGRAALPATRRNLASLKCWSKFKTNMLRILFRVSHALYSFLSAKLFGTYSAWSRIDISKSARSSEFFRDAKENHDRPFKGRFDLAL